MANSINLPKRLKPSSSDLTENQMLFLDCYLLGLGEPKYLFKQLIAFSRSERESNAMMQGLLKNSDALTYMEIRSNQIMRFFKGEPEANDKKVDDTPLNEEDVRKVIIDRVSQDIISSLRDGTLDYKQGSIVEKFITKVLDYDEKEEEKPEPPRIYLPESCSSCRYRKAIEDSDNTVDECLLCRYRKDSIERGVEYDYKNQLIEENEN